MGLRLLDAFTVPPPPPSLPTDLLCEGPEELLLQFPECDIDGKEIGIDAKRVVEIDEKKLRKRVGTYISSGDSVLLVAMEKLLGQEQGPTIGKDGIVIVDIESLVPSSEICSGSPKMSKALSRKGSNRTERRNAEDIEANDGSKKVAAKVVCSQGDHSNQIPVPNKTIASVIPNVVAEAGEGKTKRFHRLSGFHPRRILLLFAAMSSMGTMILIYFTLAINRRDGL